MKSKAQIAQEEKLQADSEAHLSALIEQARDFQRLRALGRPAPANISEGKQPAQKPEPAKKLSASGSGQYGFPTQASPFGQFGGKLPPPSWPPESYRQDGSLGDFVLPAEHIMLHRELKKVYTFCQTGSTTALEAQLSILQNLDASESENGALRVAVLK